MKCSFCVETIDASKAEVFYPPCEHTIHHGCAFHICQDKAVNKIACPTCFMPFFDAELFDEDKKAAGLKHYGLFNDNPNNFCHLNEYSTEDQEQIQRIDDLRDLMMDRIDPIWGLKRKEERLRKATKRAKMAELDALDPSRVERRKNNMEALCYNMLRIQCGMGGLNWNEKEM